jgi:hypothetical protein
MKLMCVGMAAAAVLAMAATVDAAAKKGGQPKTHVELGRVKWLRDFDAAKAAARKTGKPIMILFDEVPGCGGCKQFGQRVLSHPLVVDAAENAFVPLAIRNNSKGDADAKIVKQFGMPRWAYPEVRFLDPNNPTPSGDLVPRQKLGWQTNDLPARMIAALRQAGRDVPTYLATLETPEKTETACFSMYCYWTGEKNLSGIDGVLGTTIGWLDRKEVIELTYDPNKVDFETLAKVAKKSCGRKVGVFARSKDQLTAAKKLDMPAKLSDKKVDTKRTLQEHGLLRYPEYWFLPLSEGQATRLNWLAYQRKPDKMDAALSPTQKALKKRIAAAAKPMGTGYRASKVMLKGCGRPGRTFTATVAYQSKLEEFLAESEKERAGKGEEEQGAP